eukprot:gene28340-34216_t
MLKKFMNKGKEEAPAEASAEQASKEEEESVKEEKNLTRILEMARKMYYEKKIVGSIEVARSFAIFNTSVSCDIDGSEPEEVAPEDSAVAVKAEEQEKLTRFETLVFRSLTKAVNNLENRAKAYRNKPYRKDLTISTGIYTSDPILGISSLSVSCSATVESLLAALEMKASTV